MNITQPFPEEIKSARASGGLTQGQAAKLIHVDISTWQRWEMGDRKMHPAMWELFLIKTGHHSPPPTCK